MSRRTTYLLHFIDPETGQPARYQHAGHYIGDTEKGREDGRLEEHREGRGAVLTAAARRAGLDFVITRTWPGGASKARQLKTRSGALYCPECSEHPEPGTRPRRPGAKYLTRRQREAARRAREARQQEAREAAAAPGAEAQPPGWCWPGKPDAPCPGCESRGRTAHTAQCDERERAVARFLADIGAEPRKETEMTDDLTEVDIASQATPREAGELLRVLEEGSLAAWHYAGEAARGDPEKHGARLEYAAEVDGVYRDGLWQTIDTGARLPAETVAEFGERVEREAEDPLTGPELDEEIGRLALQYPEYGPGELVPWGDRLSPADGRRAAELQSAQHQAEADTLAAEPGDECGDRDLWAPGHLYGDPECTAAERPCSECGQAAGDWHDPGCRNDPALAGFYRLGHEPGPDAAGRTAEADAPDHLYGAPECTEADPETEHFGWSQPEPEDAGRFPLPRVLDAREASPALAPVAATLPDHTPHMDPFLAARGWEARGGLYQRTAMPQCEREAG